MRSITNFIALSNKWLLLGRRTCVLCFTMRIAMTVAKVAWWEKIKAHLRLSVATNKGKLVGIGFGLAEHYQAIQSGAPFEMLYTLDENEWNGNISLQLRIRTSSFKLPQLLFKCDSNAVIEASCAAISSPVKSLRMVLASCFPSSTPHWS